MEFLFDQKAVHWHSFFLKIHLPNTLNMNQISYKIKIDISFDKNHDSKIFYWSKESRWIPLFEENFFLSKEKLQLKGTFTEEIQPYQNNGLHCYSHLHDINNILSIKVNEYYQKVIKLLGE
jgi:hypothetical protein